MSDIADTLTIPENLSENADARPGSAIMRPVEMVAAALVAFIIGVLLLGVVSRYVFALAFVWVDEVASIAFSPRKFYAMLVETAALSGAILMILGCVLESLPAIVLLAPLMFPIAKSLGINDVHYAMVVVTAMNIGLMAPPIGIGFYIACKIGNVSPDEAMGAIWPYLIALLIGLVVIALVPGFSTWVL